MLEHEGQCWVAVYTASRAEKQVYVRLQNAGFEAFLPLVKERHQWSDRVKLVEEPLFRSYVFVRIDKLNEVRLREVPGVVCIVTTRGGIVPVIPDYQIAAVRALVEADQKLYVRESEALCKGALVTVKDGPFKGMHGMLISDCQEGNFSIRIEAIGLTLITAIDKLLLKPEE